ncbi:MAG: fasciclin domain-containing protein [Bacteroidetes bacterium]|nr:fasciclin domain-containing protein [Bacteroidota bacterium]
MYPSAGTYTLFAPEDTYFKAYLTSKKVASVNDIPVDELKNLLLYHCLDKKILSQDLTLDIVSYPSMLAKKSINLNRSTTFTVTVNANRVIVSNLEPTNGAIFVIPKVLVP